MNHEIYSILAILTAHIDNILACVMMKNGRSNLVPAFCPQCLHWLYWCQYYDVK